MCEREGYDGLVLGLPLGLGGSFNWLWELLVLMIDTPVVGGGGRVRGWCLGSCRDSIKRLEFNYKRKC